MRISLSKIVSEIANMLSLKHNKKIVYKIITQNNFCVMIGLSIEPNRFTPNVFSVRYFVQALYLPSSFIDLSLGDIIGEWEKQNVSTALSTIKESFNLLFGNINNIGTIVEYVNDNHLPYFGSIDNKFEFIAYSYLAMNKYDCAMDYLNKIVSMESEENSAWRKELINRAKEMLYLIKQRKWEKIESELLHMEDETIKTLHLSE